MFTRAHQNQVYDHGRQQPIAKEVSFFQKHIKSVKHADYPPEAGTGYVGDRTIRLYIEPHKKLWLHRDDLEWCIQ